MFTANRRQNDSSDTMQQGRVGAGTVKRPIFEETSERAIKAAHRRKWTMIATVALVVLIGAGLLGFSWYKGRQERALTQAYLEIDAIYQNENQAFEEKLKTDPKLNTPDARPDHAGSTQKFEEFAKTYSKAPIGWQAALRASNNYIEQQKYAEAQALLEPLLIKTLKHVVFQVRVRKTLAGILAEQGQMDKALEELNFLEKLAENPIVADVKLMRAQILFKKGQKEDAANLLRELAADKSPAEGSARSIASEAALWLGYWGL
ncbi:MAG: YfgM family protein [Silvanigrellaceae bacterium]